MLNASVGMQRVRERLRPTPISRPARGAGLERLTVTAQGLKDRIGTIAHQAIALRPRLPWLPDHAIGRRRRPRAVIPSGLGPRSLGAGPRTALWRRRHPAAHRIARTSAPLAVLAVQLHERVRSQAVVPLAVAVIVLFASVASGAPGQLTGPPIGGPTGNGSEPRLAIAGLTGNAGNTVGGGSDARESDAGTTAGSDTSDEDVARVLGNLGPEARALTEEPVVPVEGELIDGPFLEDGTLLKPIAVDTTVADGSGLVRRYRVRSGDTLVGIAGRFDVQMMTIWWANRLHSKNDLRVGQVLRIPTVDGLVVQVREGDTLDSIARTNHVKADAIYELNGLTDRTLVMGQTLVIPGARGDQIKVPKTSSRPSARPRSTRPARPPARYSGGAFAWPAPGGYISQYFHYGHYGLDIANDYGSTVRSAASGTVIWAGYRDNCGGYQVWVAHGSGLYTTYNHLSSISVGRGQHVSRAQQVGRIGTSGCVTGPHVHFEVWRGPVWNGGTRVNPLIYY